MAKLLKEYDYIIVGQGLAGTCLASELMGRGKDVLVFDSSKLPSASAVAGGLYNPVTGRNMVLTWKALQLFPFLDQFYKKLEFQLGEKFLFHMPLFRPFHDVEEYNEWQGRAAQSNYKQFVDRIDAKSMHQGFAKNPKGGVTLRMTGYLDTLKLITAFRALLQEKGWFLDEKFNYQELNFLNDKVVYKEHFAKKLIFCDGPLGFGNKLVDKIKFHPLKGEVLQLEIDYNSNFILNRNAFVLPRNGHYIAGSNYDLNGTDWQPSESARIEISEKINKIVSAEYKIIGQRAGLRPTSHDRRPVVGLLPTNEHLGVFNGLGTKGVSLAPYYSAQFADFLVNNGDLDIEVQVGRYFD